MKAEAYARLVEDALYGRYKEGTGCFVSDRSCRLLSEIGEPVLQTIETIVLKVALPFYHCVTLSLDEKFAGLRGLLITYFQIAKQTRSEASARFFGKLHGSLRVAAIHAVGTVWMREPVPEAILGQVRELQAEASGDVLDAARWLIESQASTQ